MWLFLFFPPPAVITENTHTHCRLKSKILCGICPITDSDHNCCEMTPKPRLHLSSAHCSFLCLKILQAKHFTNNKMNKHVKHSLLTYLRWDGLIWFIVWDYMIYSSSSHVCCHGLFNPRNERQTPSVRRLSKHTQQLTEFNAWERESEREIDTILLSKQVR